MMLIFYFASPESCAFVSVFVPNKNDKYASIFFHTHTLDRSRRLFDDFTKNKRQTNKSVLFVFDSFVFCCLFVHMIFVESLHFSQSARARQYGRRTQGTECVCCQLRKHQNAPLTRAELATLNVSHRVQSNACCQM